MKSFEDLTIEEARQIYQAAYTYVSLSFQPDPRSTQELRAGLNPVRHAPAFARLALKDAIDKANK